MDAKRWPADEFDTVDLKILEWHSCHITSKGGILDALDHVGASAEEFVESIYKAN